MNSTQTCGIKVPVGHICVNSRWKGSKLVSDLQVSLPVHYETSTSVIDFHPSCNTGVVYILEADVIAGAYKRSVARLRKANNIRGIVLVEKTSTTSQYYYDVQKFCVSDLGLSVVPIADHKEAAAYLIQMVYVESRLDSNPFMKPAHAPVADVAIMTALTTCSGVGETKALALLDKFPSLQLLSKATPEELSAVIGKASAGKLYDFFHRVT
ncbi:hypothetical protein BsWGS_16469 [Bradybaena similaris]